MDISVTAAIGLGKLLGLLIVWFRGLFKSSPEKYQFSELPKVETIFFDREMIRNLKC
jgi:hypothetical protein